MDICELFKDFVYYHFLFDFILFKDFLDLFYFLLEEKQVLLILVLTFYWTAVLKRRIKH